MKNKIDLEELLAELEEQRGQLLSELRLLDQLMIQVGFSGGVSALKEAAEEYRNAQQLIDE